MHEEKERNRKERWGARRRDDESDGWGKRERNEKRERGKEMKGRGMGDKGRRKGRGRELKKGNNRAEQCTISELSDQAADNLAMHREQTEDHLKELRTQI